MLKPWEKSHGRREEADEVEDGVSKLPLHVPVGIGGTVAGDTDTVVQQGHQEVHEEAAYHDKGMDGGLWKKKGGC